MNRSFAHLHERRRRHTAEVLKSRSAGFLPNMSDSDIHYTPHLDKLDPRKLSALGEVGDEPNEDDIGVVDLGDLVDLRFDGDAFRPRRHSDPLMAPISMALLIEDDEMAPDTEEGAEEDAEEIFNEEEEEDVVKVFSRVQMKD